MEIKSKAVDLAKTNDMLQLPELTLLKNSTTACLSLHNEKAGADQSDVGYFCMPRQTKGVVI
jgi:hypothetical protein